MIIDPIIKQKWVESLRSGNYKQGKTFLGKKQPNGEFNYCCLGVLCDIQSDEIKKEYGIHYKDGYLICNDFETGLTSSFAKFINITDYNNKKMIYRILISLNDIENKSFKEIADWIEINL